MSLLTSRKQIGGGRTNLRTTRVRKYKPLHSCLFNNLKSNDMKYPNGETIEYERLVEIIEALKAHNEYLKAENKRLKKLVQ